MRSPSCARFRCSPGATSTRRSSSRPSQAASTSSCTSRSIAPGRGGSPRSRHRRATCTGASVDADTIFETRDDVLVATGARPARLEKFRGPRARPRRSCSRGRTVSLVFGALLGLGLLLVAAPFLWPAHAGAGPPSNLRAIVHGELALAGLGSVPIAVVVAVSLALAVVAAAIAQAIFAVPVLTIVAAALGLAARPRTRPCARDQSSRSEPGGVARCRRPPRRVGAGGHVAARERRRARRARPDRDASAFADVRPRLSPHRQLRRSASTD